MKAELARALLSGFDSGLAPLDPCENDLQFIEKYGLKIDSHAFDFGERYKHLRPVYEDDHDFQVLMAGAQSGKSARIMVRQIRSAVVKWGSMVGYYFPDFFLPGIFSRSRFRPMLMSSDELGPWLGRQKAGDKKNAADGTLTRQFGKSQFLFLSIKGKTATEGNPMQSVFFDEVRKMEHGDVERAMERYSAQVDPWDCKVSTANYPESDIHHWFLKGDQRFFHTDCKCSDGIVLSLTFPDCVADMRHVTPQLKAKIAHKFSHAGLPYLGMSDKQRAQFGEAAYICPKCGEILVDQRAGWWQPHNPAAYVHSYQMPQLLSFTYPAARMLHKFENAQDIQEFHNSGLGMPFVDPRAQPVHPEHLAACVNTAEKWPMRRSHGWRKRNLKNSALGADVQAGYLVVVIKQLSPNGKHRTIHLAIAHGENPWIDLAHLMEAFDVRVAVIDAQPSWDEAHRFAKAFKGRVFLSTYVDGPDNPVAAWQDTKSAKQEKGEIKFRHRVLIHRTKGLQWSLGRWEKRHNEVPDPGALLQDLPVDGNGRVVFSSGLSQGTWRAVQICKTYFLHLQRVVIKKVFATEEAERRGKWRMVAEHVGLDPHFAHANLYADVALTRIAGRATPRQA